MSSLSGALISSLTLRKETDKRNSSEKDRNSPQITADLKDPEELRELVATSSPISAGEFLPHAIVFIRGHRVDLHDYFRRRKGVIFGVMGAFLRVCSQRHLPGFRDNMGALRARGVDFLGCLAVNDPAVLKAWAETLNVPPNIVLISDFNASLTRTLGLQINLTGYGLGQRCRRFSMIVSHSKVCWIGFDEDAFVEKVLERLGSPLLDDFLSENFTPREEDQSL